MAILYTTLQQWFVLRPVTACKTFIWNQHIIGVCVCGVWCVVCGVWCVVCGVWCVVCGVWCVVCGVCVCVCVCVCVVHVHISLAIVFREPHELNRSSYNSLRLFQETFPTHYIVSQYDYI